MVLLSELKPKHNRLKITVKLKIKIQKRKITDLCGIRPDVKF